MSELDELRRLEGEATEPLDEIERLRGVIADLRDLLLEAFALTELAERREARDE